MTDPLMNPPAPSGRRDDSSPASDGEAFTLPAGTRRYVDAGGAKHFILPDGTSRYVPPGEVGNFNIEGEDPQGALRRHLVKKLPYADAVRVNAMMDRLFDALDEMRKAGAAVKLVPLNPDDDKELSELLENAYSANEPPQYPKAKYHPDFGFKAVANEDEEGDLDGDWHDTQEDAKKAAEGRDRPNANDPFRDPRIQRSDEARIGDTGGVIKPDVAPADKPHEVTPASADMRA